jgi:hypothetical protein
LESLEEVVGKVVFHLQGWEVSVSTSGISRRSFVGALPLTVLAAPSLGEGLLRPSRSPDRDPQQSPGPGFIGPFTPQEAEAVASSPMAQAMASLHGQGYPCSEMMLLVGLRGAGLPDHHLDAAAVFGGGVGKRDLCGLLTGGLMAIGFAAGKKYSDRAEVHRVGRRASNAYWDWWTSRGDLHCMGPGTEHQDAESFLRMTQRTAVKLEEVLGVLEEGGYESKA